MSGNTGTAVASRIDGVPWPEALRFWHRLGWISFDGPAGQIALMDEEVVERRGWVSEERFGA